MEASVLCKIMFILMWTGFLLVLFYVLIVPVIIVKIVNRVREQANYASHPDTYFVHSSSYCESTFFFNNHIDKSFGEIGKMYDNPLIHDDVKKEKASKEMKKLLSVTGVATVYVVNEHIIRVIHQWSGGENEGFDSFLKTLKGGAEVDIFPGRFLVRYMK